MKQFKNFGIKPVSTNFIGDKIDIDKILNKEIIVYEYRLADSKYEKGNGKCLSLQIEFREEKRVVFTGSGVLMDLICRIDKNDFPFVTTIVKENKRYEFT